MARSDRTHARGGTGRFLLGALLLLGSSAAATPQADRNAARVEAVLSAKGPWGERARKVRVKKLVEFGPASIPALLACLAGTESDDGGGREWWGGSSRATDIVPPALAHFRSSSVLPQLQRMLAAEDAGLAAQVAVLLVLGHVPSTDLALQAADDLGASRLKDSRLRELALEALTRALDEEQGALHKVRMTKDWEDDVLEVVVDALGRCRSEEAMNILLELLGRDLRVDLRILEAIPVLHARIPWHFDDPSSYVVPHLQSEQARVRRAAAECLGRLHDPLYVPDLIAMLDDEDRGVRRAAQTALRGLAGKTSGDEKVWKEWFASEQERWETLRDSLDGRLESVSPAAAMALVRELSSETVFRDDAALALAEQMDGRAAGLQRAMCLGLRRLGSAQAVPHLARLLDSPDDSVSNAAWQTLRHITRQDLPHDSRAWGAFIDS